jgi:hypothetical protein
MQEMLKLVTVLLAFMDLNSHRQKNEYVSGYYIYDPLCKRLLPIS